MREVSRELGLVGPRGLGFVGLVDVGVGRRGWAQSRSIGEGLTAVFLYPQDVPLWLVVPEFWCFVLAGA